MKFSVFVPPNASARPRPALYFLTDLTCTEETSTCSPETLT
jgi:hypothetical protein